MGKKSRLLLNTFSNSQNEKKCVSGINANGTKAGIHLQQSLLTGFIAKVIMTKPNIGPETCAPFGIDRFCLQHIGLFCFIVHCAERKAQDLVRVCF